MTPHQNHLRTQARAARAKNDFANADRYYRQLTSTVSGVPDIWVDWGEMLAASQQWDKAESAFRRAITIKPDYALGWHNLGYLLYHLRRDQDAIEALLKAQKLDPDHAGTYVTLGAIYHQHNRDQEALACFDRATALNPKDVAAFNNKGLILQKHGKLVEAVQVFLHAMEIDLGDAATHNNLGLCLFEMGQLFGAARCYERALERDPRQVHAMNNMGNALAGMGRIDDALAYFHRAIEIDPAFFAARSNYMFNLLHKDGVTLQEILDVHLEWAQQYETPLKSKWQPHANLKDPNRPLKIGFISGDFRNHPVFYFTISTLRELQKDNNFMLIAYANQHENNECTQQAKDCFTVWHQIPHWTDDQLVAQIRADQIDILIDLSGHNDRHRLQALAQKPAPVQITWAGYMATTGLQSIDYLFGDEVQTPAADQPFYTEKLVQLPNCFINYTPPAYAPDIAPEPPVKRNGFITFGCFNKPAKISRRCIELWSEILKRVPNSRLMMKFYGLKDEATSQFFAEQFAAFGISRNRLLLEGPSLHAELLDTYSRQIDIALDSLPYTGSTTTLEALWMGVPVIARRGNIFPARHSSTYLTAIGRTDWIADNDQAFVEKAVALAANIKELDHCRQYLRNWMAESPLCRSEPFTENFKSALRSCWQSYCTG